MGDPVKDDWETTCPESPDDLHCVHWYDGEACHFCGDEAMSEDDKVEQGVVEGPVRNPNG
jgi:hypothetical protein